EVGRRKTRQARLAWMIPVVAIPLNCQNCSGENRLNRTRQSRIITGRSQKSGQIPTRVARWLQTCPKYSRKEYSRLHPKACVPPNPCVLRHSCEARLLSAPPLASAGTTRMEPSPLSPQEIVLFAETFVAAQIEEPKLSHANLPSSEHDNLESNLRDRGKRLFFEVSLSHFNQHRLPARSCVKQRLSSYQRMRCASGARGPPRRHVKGRGGYAETLRCGLAKGKTSAPEVSACYFFVYQR